MATGSPCSLPAGATATLANHPIISLIILFYCCDHLSLIKALGRLIEMTGWYSAPFKFGQVLIAASAKSLGKFGA